MLHKTIKAAATATDEGKFTAIAAAYTVDRTNEKIVPGAFGKTISRWQSSGKVIPLHWDHEGDPESIIGHADPKSMREAEEGLYVRGQLDLEGNEKARAAWRVMKANSIGLSFGYLVTDDETVDDVKHLKEIDLFEISITPAPVNPDTRIVSMKSQQVKRPADAPEWSKEDAERFREEWKRTGVYADTSHRKTGAPWMTVNEARAKENLPPVEGGEKKLSEDAGETKELSEQVAADLRKGYDRLAIELMAAGVPEAKAESPESSDDKLSDVEDEVPDEEQQIEDARTEEPSEVKVEAQDPLRKAYDDLALELQTRGITQAEPPKVEETPTVDSDFPTLAELRKHSYDLMLETLIGSEKT